MVLEEMALADAHTHIDSYSMYDPFVCRERKVVYGDSHDVRNLDGLERHLTRDTVEEAYCIFSDIASLDEIQERFQRAGPRIFRGNSRKL